ncbi:hybrid sensor histidine kinase/response regulator transcription factor [Bacteroides sp. 51]|uniref:hybrid sensor histidine kinase/response regulator transcription factor n=1 Tax=Bacteroides sp. 51 TaxID=2302938 RepID=UPI0013D1C23C|nr:hybrid sensor histidine kinase/response regulator transcription factor [Bacteroides sp. 51]NDV81565.1 hybrid sensor histidine kinase/response regulator [Bacteroides sp. 51]
MKEKHNFIIRYILLLFFIALYVSLYASEVKFYNINSMYGISMRKTSSVCKDDDGFIWASSRTGILRITGEDHHIYQLPYETADFVTVKLAYANSSLHAYTSNGQLFLYNKLYDRFDLITDLRKLMKNNYLSLYKMVVLPDGSFWLGTSTGLYRYKDNSLERIGVDEGHIRTITPYINNSLFFSTDNGIKSIDLSTLKTEYVYENKPEQTLFIYTFYYNPQTNQLWVGTLYDGLYCLDLSEKQLRKTLITNFPKDPIRAIVQNNDSTLLIGIDGKGIWKLTKDGNTVLDIYKENIDNPSSLRGDGVYDIFCDESKRVWVSTYSGGLSFFDQESPALTQITHQINNPNSLVNNNINRVLEDSRGDIWFATDNGISRWKRAINKWETYYKDMGKDAQAFLALCEDNDGNIWAGTYSSGVFILDGRTGKEIKHYYHNDFYSGFSAKFVFDIYKDNDGDIWIGGIQSPMQCYSAKEKRFRSYNNQPVNYFQEISPGKILATVTYGLIQINKEKGNFDVLMQGYIVQDIVIIQDDIWIATCGDGLLRFNYKSGEIKKFTMESGLLSNYVNSIIISNGHLMLGTENGFCKFNLNDYTVHTYPSVFSFSNVSYNITSRTKLKSGELIWGTNNGAILFDPNMLYETQFKGRIFYQDISVSGRSIREIPELLKVPVDKQTRLSLSYTQNSIMLELLPIGVSSSRCRFSWKMEGIDSEWSNPSNLQTATYTNLPSGNFQLKFRMYDSSLSQIIDERWLDIRIIPPFWKTWWFSLIIVFLAIALTITSFKTYINRLKRKHTEDKIRFFTNMAHDIRTSLTLINAPIEELNKERNLSKNGHYYLNLATEQSSRLSFVATQLLDIQKVDIGKGQIFLTMTDIVRLIYQRKLMFETSASKNQIELLFTSNRESFITAVDEVKIEKVVDNLFSNAIKYSHPQGRVEISLVCNDKEWELKVKDYGLGISENAQKKLFREFYRGDNAVNSKMVGSGIGLLLVKNYVSMHKGTTTVDSNEGAGSLFTIAIPYKQVSESKIENKQKVEASVPFPSDVIVDMGLTEYVESENTTEKKIHLLLVEDNNDLQEFMKQSLREYFTISTAGDGKGAWEMIEKKAPDLIISDIMMPNMDGFELCKLVKSTFETSHIPVILLTALSDKTQKLEGLGLGADDYITKPFDMTLLTQRIRSIIKNREVVKEKALKLFGKAEEKEQPILTNELNDKFVKKAVEVVQRNMANSVFGKDEFAAEMFASPSLLYKKLKALTGQSPVDFIKIIRLNYAMELLTTQKYTVTEVSEYCGFSSVGYFSKVFKKHFGKSPTEL